MVYSGDATEITLRDLKPATEYYLKVHALLDDLKGNMAEFVTFKTMCCEPDAPQPPKLHTRSVSTIAVKWTSPVTNGSKVTSYILECDQGHGGDESSFVEVYGGSAHQYKLTKLAPSTSYTLRLAAVNSFGKSEFSVPVAYSTTGTVPSQPDPPMLS
jgi:predicted phage tail protein